MNKLSIEKQSREADIQIMKQFIETSHDKEEIVEIKETVNTEIVYNDSSINNIKSLMTTVTGLSELSEKTKIDIENMKQSINTSNNSIGELFNEINKIKCDSIVNYADIDLKFNDLNHENIARKEKIENMIEKHSKDYMVRYCDIQTIFT